MLNLGLAANLKIELISELLSNTGNEVEILSQGEVVERRLKFYRAFAEPKPADRRIPVFYASALPIRFVNGVWSAFQTLRLFYQRLRVSPFDVVILYNLKLPQVICGLFAIRRGLPVILEYEDDALVDINGMITNLNKRGFEVRLVRKLLAAISGCIGVSPHLLSQVSHTVPKLLLRGVISENIASATDSGSERKKWVVFSGTFYKSKGLEQLLRAWNMMDAPGWELHISGDGQLAGVVREMAERNKSIVFHGLLHREEIARFLRRATIGINPHDLSNTPGNVFAFKIIEYLAAGTHVITTPMGSLEGEIEAGITYMPDNAPTTIARTIRSVIEKRDYERTASDAALRIYCPAVVARSLDDLLHRVLAGSAN
jgi:glycosyltransferase involved in cell wall biosynthesis